MREGATSPNETTPAAGGARALLRATVASLLRLRDSTDGAPARNVEVVHRPTLGASEPRRPAPGPQRERARDCGVRDGARSRRARTARRTPRLGHDAIRDRDVVPGPGRSEARARPARLRALRGGAAVCERLGENVEPHSDDDVA